ncbi:MAG: hybrid sensor histidine kinase/response regulator, partial [Candidatus Latescibacterota bacterium]
ERKHAEEQLRNSEARLRSMIEHQPDGVCLLSEHLELMMVNQEGRTCLNVLGCLVDIGERLEWIGDRALVDILMGQSGHRLQEVMVEVTEETYTFEIYGRALTEHIRGGGWVVIIRNVTAERDMQERAQQQDRLAAVGQLAAGIAHDFNNLLTGINGFAQLLELRSDMPEPAKEILQRIYSQGDRAAQLVRQILDFSRKSVAERHPMALIPFFKEMVRLLQRILPESIEIDSDIEGDDHVVVANPTQLQQVLTNLAVNARDAMPDGGKLHISLKYVVFDHETKPPLADMPLGRWSLVSLSDTGTGISDDVLNHIFEPFFTTKDVGKGTGLGMAQVYGIVKQHNGFIDIETGIGQGTTFYIYLPDSEDKNVKNTEQVGEAPKGQGETVLLVEDDFSVRQATEGMLRQLNYRIIPAFNGQDALGQYEKYHADIDAILTDVGRQLLAQQNGQ